MNLLACTRRTGRCLLVIACLALPARAALSADTHTGTDPRITLEAPEKLRELLLRHIELPPHSAMADDDARLAALPALREEITGLLETEAYFSPHIGWREDVLVVTPGEPVRVRQIDIEFTGELAGQTEAMEKRRAALREKWALPTGALFRSADWESAKATLLATVAGTDFAAAHIATSQARVDPSQASAALTLTLDSGPAYRFGEVKIEGLHRYDAARVRALAPFSPGEPYRRDALLTWQSRLQNTPWFQSVLIEAPTDMAENQSLPVKAILSEAPSKRLGLGLGYSTNTGARGEVNFRHHDLFGRALDLNSGLRYEEKAQTLFADLGLPPGQENERVTLGGKRENTLIEGLQTRRLLLGANRSRTLGRIETRLGIEWQREERQPQGGAAETDRALLLDARWIRRDVDHPFDPHRGNVIELGLGGASRHLLSTRDFIRTHVQIQQWWPMAGQDTLSVRAEAGLTASTSRFGIPQDYLFRAGGAQSVRGYGYRSLGVHEGNAIVGGRALLTGSLEYTHWFDARWGAAVFADAGDAADRWQDLRPAVGRGLGARWKSPAGPLAFDLAHGQRNDRWMLHFSLSAVF